VRSRDVGPAAPLASSTRREIRGPEDLQEITWNRCLAADRQSLMRRIILLITLLALITACSGGTDDEIDMTGNWRLVQGSVDGQAIPLMDGSPVTLNVTGTEIGGTSACNSYGSQFTLEGSTITIGDLVSTMMMCAPEVMDVEIPFTAALREVDTAAIEGEQLVMTGPGIELRFSPAG
jgi:heat shock protein HslJ